MQCRGGGLSPVGRFFLYFGYNSYPLIFLDPSFGIVFNFGILAYSFCSIEIWVNQVLLRELGISGLLAMFNKIDGMSCQLE